MRKNKWIGITNPTLEIKTKQNIFFNKNKILLRPQGHDVQIGSSPIGWRRWWWWWWALFDLDRQVVAVVELPKLQADHLVAVVFPRQLVEGRLNDASPQMKHQMQGGLSGYCILRKCNHPPAVCPQKSDAAC